MGTDNNAPDVETQTVELSSVLVTITNHLLRDANEGEPPHEHLTINAILEDHLGSEITMEDVDRVARAIPSIRSAFLRWLERRNI